MGWGYTGECSPFRQEVPHEVCSRTANVTIFVFRSPVCSDRCRLVGRDGCRACLHDLLRVPASPEMAVRTLTDMTSPSIGTQNAAPYLVGIVDNDSMALRALTSLVESLPSCDVAWAVSSGTQALQHCRRSEESPDLLLADMSLEGMQGPSLCERLRLHNGVTALLGVTSFSLVQYRSPLIAAGAQGLVSKTDEPGMIDAIRMLLAGNAMPGFETAPMAHLRLNANPPNHTLTGREEEILRICADEGLSDVEIAERLNLSPATVRKHLQHVLQKTGSRTTRQAIAEWWRRHA